MKIMKIIDINFKENGKKYFCKDINEVFEVEEGNLIAATRNFSMAELLKMEFEEIKEVKNPYTRVDYGERYYAMERTGSVGFVKEDGYYVDDNLFSIANYFNNRNYAEYIYFKETLMRKLDRFAWENNAKAMNWGDRSIKYYIIFDREDNELIIRSSCSYQSNNVYFTSKEIAKKAVEKFKDDLIKLYTWEFDF